MKNDIEKLYSEFMKIKNKGWIKSQRKGSTGIGYTFEKMIGKTEENFDLPDFCNIEIKCKHKYSKGNICLFNATPDGDILFPIKRLIDKFGYPDKALSQFKVFNNSMKVTENTKIGKYILKLKIDYEKELVKLIAFEKGEPIDPEISWTFDLLKDKLNRKLKYLAIVIAENKFVDDTEYFKYYDICFYELNNFETFIELIEKGVIRISFKIGVFKGDYRYGQIHDRGTGFDINIKDLNKLYRKINL